VDHVVAEDQRDVEPRVGHGDELRGMRRRRPGEVEQAADQALAHHGQLLGARLTVDGELVQLAELFLERHAGEQGVDLRLGAGLRGESRGDADAQGERHKNAKGGTSIRGGHWSRTVEVVKWRAPIYAIVARRGDVQRWPRRTRRLDKVCEACDNRRNCIL